MAGLSINQINIGGNLTRDIELKTVGEATIANMGIAINERKKVNGEYIESPIFLDVTAFGKLADRCSQYLKKGDAVFVEGRVTMDTWEKDGQKRSKLHVIANDIKFIKWGKDRQASAAPRDDDQAPF